MSYTIPDSVQTKAEAVLAVASAIADEDMGARYDGTVNTSLDVLADVLAAQDVDVPQTNAGAILALAQYAHGGGGGGSTVDVNIWNRSSGETLTDILPDKVRYITGFNGTSNPTYSDPLPFEPITGETSSATVHGIRVSGLPVGAFVRLTFNNDGVSVDALEFGFTTSGAANEGPAPTVEQVVPAPVGGNLAIVAGQYYLVAE